MEYCVEIYTSVQILGSTLQYTVAYNYRNARQPTCLAGSAMSNTLMSSSMPSSATLDS